MAEGKCAHPQRHGRRLCIERGLCPTGTYTGPRRSLTNHVWDFISHVLRHVFWYQPCDEPDAEQTGSGLTTEPSQGFGDKHHYPGVIMNTMESQITGVSIVRSTVCSGTDQREYQSFAKQAYVRGNHRSPDTVMRKMFPFDDLFMGSQWYDINDLIMCNDITPRRFLNH